MMTILLTGAVCCFAQTDIAGKAKVILLDGSQLIGTLNAPSLVVVTSFGRTEIPLAQISALDFAKDSVKVRFHNKDVLSGTLEDTAFAFKTVFNDVRLDYSQIKSVQFSGTGARDMNTEGLLLHVQFDSDTEDLSRFDARMDARNARIVEGPDGNGNAMLLDSEEATVVIQLPRSPYRMSEGTIEFWAKLPQPHRQFGHSKGQPWLFNIHLHENYPGAHFALGFVSNNGNGSGGLVGHAMGTLAGTHVFGAVSSVADTGVLGDTPDGWHHYALVWKWDGFDFPEEKGKALLIIVNGKVVASSNKMPGFIPPDIEHIPDVGTRLVIHDENSDCSRPIVMSNLRIWDCAKTLDQLGGEEM